MSLHQWAIEWGISAAAFYDLQRRIGLEAPTLVEGDDPGEGKSEAWAQSQVRLEASRQSCKLFRNNVGGLKDSTGRVVRYGLGNDSKTLNETIKSGDLVGWRVVIISQPMVGMKFAQFLSREIKEPGWHYTGTEREPAQKAWADIVNADGGDAGFATGPGTL